MASFRLVLAVVAACLCPRLAARTLLFTPSLGAKAVVEVTRAVSEADVPPSVHVRLRLGGIEVEKSEDGFHKIKAQGLDPIASIGNPDLTATGVLFALPPGVTPKLRILQNDSRKIENVPIQPCQVKTRCPLEQNQTWNFNSALYASENTFPAESVQWEELGTLNGLRLARLALYPLRTQPRDSSLVVSTELQVQVDFKGSPEALEIVPSVHGLVQSATVTGAPKNAHIQTEPETMILIAADALYPLMQRFIDWKRQRGLVVDAYRYSAVGGTPKAAKAFLQNRYRLARRKPSYLLLVGNAKTLPGFSESTGMGSAISDYAYSTLTGRDFIPDIFVGRLVADNEAETNTQIDRWIAYEKGSAGQDWYSKATIIASDEGINPTDEEYAAQIARALTSHTFRWVDSLFERTLTATPQNIFDSLHEGRSWLTYLGHGSGTYWISTNKYFSNADVEKVDNADRLPIIIDVSCRNGAWADSRIPTCFGKTWMTRNKAGKPTGAVAYYGGAVNLSWDEPAVMSVGIAKYHFERPVHTLGASLFAGQMYLLEKMGISSHTLDNLKWYELLGDPSMLLRTQVPLSYSAGHQSRQAGADVVLDLQARDSSGTALPGLQATLFHPKHGLLAYGTTAADGTLTLNAPNQKGLPPGTLLTTFGYNLETHEAKEELP